MGHATPCWKDGQGSQSVINKIFNIGLPKTATTSLNEALKILGYRSLHNPLKFRTLTYRHSIYKYPRDDWDALTNFGEHFYPQLDQSYPNSKFILTLRDKDEWLRSAEKWFREPPKNPPIDYQGRLETFGCMTFHFDRFSYVYDLHTANAMAYFHNRPQDLLVLDCTKGNPWQQLCPYLNKSVPGQPFPHLKKGALPDNALYRRLGNVLVNLLTKRY
jgi:hypothetical protein